MVSLRKKSERSLKEWEKLLQDNDFIGLKRYLQNEGSVDDANETHESILAVALRLRSDDIVIDYLVEYGFSLYDINEEGVSIFDYAITYNNEKLFWKILDSGIDVNETRRKSRFTPLMAAICYGRYTMADELLRRGADTQTVDYQGFKASDFARKMNKKSMAELLRRY